MVGLFGSGATVQALAHDLAARNTPFMSWPQRAHASKKVRSIAQVVEQANLLIVDMPAAALEKFLQQVAPSTRGDHTLIHTVHGLSKKAQLAHELVRSHTCIKSVGAFLAYSTNDSLIGTQPRSAVLGSRYPHVAQKLRALIQCEELRLHVTRDLIGIELTLALGPIYALTHGMAQHLGFDAISRAALAAVYIQEAAQLGNAMGADANTFTTYAGLAELTGIRDKDDPHLRAGQKIAENQSIKQIQTTLQDPLEGVQNIGFLINHGKSIGVATPFLNTLQKAIRSHDPKRHLSKMVDIYQ